MLVFSRVQTLETLEIKFVETFNCTDKGCYSLQKTWKKKLNMRIE